MEETDAFRILRAMLASAGAEWAEEGGVLRFRSRREAMLWETACRPCSGGLLIYGRFPFSVGDREKGRRICEEYNRRLVRGALYLAGDGFPVYRCRAETEDPYDAEKRIAAALEYSARVMAFAWGRLSGI